MTVPDHLRADLDGLDGMTALVIDSLADWATDFDDDARAEVSKFLTTLADRALFARYVVDTTVPNDVAELG
jgi:hypothetical protein